MRDTYIERGGRTAYEDALADVRGGLAQRSDAMCDGGIARRHTGRRRPRRRDRHLADSVLQLLDRSAPDTRIVVTAHNAPVQRPVNPEGGPLARVSMGHPLAKALGAEYVSVALTSGGGRTVMNVPDPAHPAGMRQSAAGAPQAPPDSVEALFVGVPEAQAMVVTRALRTHARRHGLPEPTRIRIRMDDGFLPVPVSDAYDEVVSVPRAALSADLTE
ncbi:erythromycin esterase family protein [Streptomyces sp. NPDC048506]|uniref:erythromycin esterase family protein n=1 Tax=Streptomyces sp. NPDC048506 TaxID=3155028 RepID=UPI00343A9AB6